MDVGGGAKSAVRIQVDPAALASMGLSIDNVRAVLQGQNKDEPKGAIDGDRIRFTMNANDQLFTADRYQNLIIGEKNGVPIPLSAVGRAIDATEDRLQAAWLNSKRAVVMFIRKQADANVIETVDRIKAILPQLQRWLPPAIHLQIRSDRTITIRASVADVQTSLLISIALVVMVCFLFLRRVSTTFIACTTVPLALAGTFAIMFLLKFSLDNISLMALTISVGFVVDDAIVVIENIVRHLEQGLTPLEATLRGARQIGFTVVSIAISLVAVFIPLLFMGGIIGRQFHEFSVTLSVAILVSAVVSLTLTPMLCSRWLRKEKPEQTQGWFYRATEKIYNDMLGFYSRSLRWVLRHSFLMLLVTAATICLTVWLYNVVPKGFFPQQDTGMVFGLTEAAQDISFGAMVEKQNLVTEIVKNDPTVASVTSAVGSGGGGSLNTGRMFITLKARKERNMTATEVVSRIRGKTARIPGIGVFLQAAQDIRIGGRATKGQYIYSLVSPSQEDLNTYAPKLMAALKKSPKLKDLTTDQQQRGLQSNVVVDRVKASQVGIQAQQVDSALYSAFGQREVSTVYINRDQFHVILEALPQYLADPTTLDKIYVSGTSGIQVPLSAIAHFQTSYTPAAINHQGQFPAVTFSFNLDPGTSLQQATEIIEKAASEIEMPETIRGSFQGTATDVKQA